MPDDMRELMRTACYGRMRPRPGVEPAQRP